VAALITQVLEHKRKYQRADMILLLDAAHIGAIAAAGHKIDDNSAAHRWKEVWLAGPTEALTCRLL